MAWTVSEYQCKLRRLRQLMLEEQLDFVLLSNQLGIRWLTGGRPYVNQAADKACADLLIDKDKVYLVSNNIEIKRLQAEEFNGLEFEGITYNWWEAQGMQQVLKQIVGDGKLALEPQLAAKLALLRWNLLPEEQERYRETGSAVAAILEYAAFRVAPGMSEIEVAKVMKQKAIEMDVNPWITLVAADDRGYKYRHFLPTENTLHRYVLLSMTAEKHGLFASATRLVHFGAVDKELSKRYEAVAYVDAAYIASTVSGALVAKIFAGAIENYRHVGCEGEWKNHHQGGMIGYQSREFRATAERTETVLSGQAYAWNPTIAGVKSEDTILVTDNGPVILTKSRNFPVREFVYNDIAVKRPAILVR